jgi:predicted RNase H-like HicB family nuclease
MEQTRRLTAIIEREDDGFVALCPEVDVASQGSTIEEARANLVEALTLFFEVADESEISRRVPPREVRDAGRVPGGVSCWSSPGTKSAESWNSTGSCQ